MKRYSILKNLDKCFFCQKPSECIHEVFYGRNRQVSIKNGFCVGLCNSHHNMAENSVHYNKRMDLELKRVYEKEYLKGHSLEEFIKLIGKSYL